MQAGANGAGDALLRIEELAVFYGGIQALKGVSVHLDKGELLAIIGANGAGKTTLLRTLSAVLRARRLQRAGTLSGGEQQMCAIGRALMARPRLLMLDEPSLGLAPLLVERIFEVIARLKAEGVTLLLVEQNARMALEVADRAYVMETGRIKLSGSAAELAANPEVERAYLGG